MFRATSRAPDRLTTADVRAVRFRRRPGITFPHIKEVQAEFRVGAGVARVLPGKTVATGMQGTAIDWWLRMLIDPAVSLDLPLAGLMKRPVRCVPAGLDLLGQLGAVTPGRTVVPMRPAAFADRDDEWWARVCYALALCVELYRAATVEHSRLARLDTDSYRIDTVAVYAVRFGYLASWPLDQLCARIAGGSVSIGALRREFAHVVRSEFSKREKIG